MGVMYGANNRLTFRFVSFRFVGFSCGFQTLPDTTNHSYPFLHGCISVNPKGSVSLNISIVNINSK